MLLKRLNMMNLLKRLSNLVKKNTDYSIKIMKLKKTTDQDHSNKYITAKEFNKLKSENFASRLAQANLASKNDIANFVKTTDFDDKLKNLHKKVTSYKTKQNMKRLKRK